MRLTDLKVGETKIITGVETADTTLSRELKELGFVPGTEVSLISKGLFGNPLAYKIRGTVFALRKHEAEIVFV